MARKNTQVYNVFEANNRVGGDNVKSKTPVQKYVLPNDINLDDTIDYISPEDIFPHPENANLFDKIDNETLGRWEPFIDDIKQNGIHDPIIVRISDMTILTGHRRHKAAIELGLNKVPVRYLTGDLSNDDSIKFMVRDNAQRRHWSNTKWLKIYRKIYPNFDSLLLKENRGGSHGNQYTDGKVPVSTLPNENKLTAKDVAIDTGQKIQTVKNQFVRIRKNLKEEKPANNNKSKTVKSDENVINEKFIKLVQKHLGTIKQKIPLENLKTRKETIKLVTNLSKELRKEF